jgi:Tfp pilus assembly protein PilW
VEIRGRHFAWSSIIADTMKKKCTYTRGTSLLELLIYLAIFSLMAVFLSAMFLTIARSRAVANARFEVQENLRFAVERIRQTVYDASIVDTSGACPTNVLSAGNGLATTTFQVTNGVLEMREGDAGVFYPLTSSLVSATVPNTASDCLFKKISNAAPAKSTVQIRLKVEYNDLGRAELKWSDSARTTIVLR